MKHIKLFENFNDFDNENINILLDISGSISHEQLYGAILKIKDEINKSAKINLIQFDHNVRNFSIINIDDIFDIKLSGGGGTNVQPAIDYLVDNNLENNKTYIISDFYFDEEEFPELSDYEFIKIDNFDENDEDEYGNKIDDYI